MLGIHPKFKWLRWICGQAHILQFWSTERKWTWYCVAKTPRLFSGMQVHVGSFELKKKRKKECLFKVATKTNVQKDLFDTSRWKGATAEPSCNLSHRDTFALHREVLPFAHCQLPGCCSLRQTPRTLTSQRIASYTAGPTELSKHKTAPPKF